MPFLVKYLIENRSKPVVTRAETPVAEALSLMARHDFSQLPVVNQENRPLGMVTYESILRGLRSFKSRLVDLHVRDVMTPAPTFSLEDDLFDLLAQLKITNAVLILNAENTLAGIVTTYDSTEYFRNRAENMMRVEDIETMIKEINLLAYTRPDGVIDEQRLAESISKTSNYDEKSRSYDDLSLGQYIAILMNKSNWTVFEPIFQISREAVRNLLDDVRNTRNDLAHFRSEITIEQIEQLRFCSDWLAKRLDDFQKARQEELVQALFTNRQDIHPEPMMRVAEPPGAEAAPVEMIVEQPAPGQSRYTPLADWLVSQPGEVQQVTLTFNEIEAIISGDLPASARNHRAWWGNDMNTHPQSRLWLEAGWRTTFINMTEQRVTFARIIEREKAYIDFYSKLLEDLRQKTNLPVRDFSPSGTSWIYYYLLSAPDYSVASFNLSFSRDQRFRLELYLDAYDQAKTKQIFDRIHADKASIEDSLGALSWERIDNKRASRIALYNPGSITDSAEKLAALRAWVVQRLPDFHKILDPIAVRAAQEVMQP